MEVLQAGDSIVSGTDLAEGPACSGCLYPLVFPVTPEKHLALRRLGLLTCLEASCLWCRSPPWAALSALCCVTPRRGRGCERCRLLRALPHVPTSTATPPCSRQLASLPAHPFPDLCFDLVLALDVRHALRRQPPCSPALGRLCVLQFHFPKTWKPLRALLPCVLAELLPAILHSCEWGAGGTRTFPSEVGGGNPAEAASLMRVSVGLVRREGSPRCRETELSQGHNESANGEHWSGAHNIPTMHCGLPQPPGLGALSLYHR